MLPCKKNLERLFNHLNVEKSIKILSFHTQVLIHFFHASNIWGLWKALNYYTYMLVTSDCDSKDCNPPGSSVHGILQARILEWVAIPFSRGSS